MNVSVGVAFPDRLRLKAYATFEYRNSLRFICSKRILCLRKTFDALPLELKICGGMFSGIGNFG